MSKNSFTIKLIKQLKIRLIKDFVIIKNLLTFQGKVYLPKKFRNKFLELYYAKLENRHFDK